MKPDRNKTLLPKKRRLAQLVSFISCWTMTPLALSETLSHYLMAQQTPIYTLGVSWQTPSARIRQAALKEKLIQSIKEFTKTKRNTLTPNDQTTWIHWLQSLPVTGRVPLASSDPNWLMTNPEHDPVIHDGDHVVLPAIPTTITVVQSNGQLCNVLHQSGAHAADYLASCNIHDADWAYLAEPDAHIERVGVSLWNSDKQPELAPGAWLWAPPRNSGWNEKFSWNLIEFLATQGPAPDHPDVVAPIAMPRAIHQTPLITANDWGIVGLLQTPTARMRPAGSIALSVSHVHPYTRDNVFIQPFDWLELGFRYTDINNVLYGPQSLSGNQTYKDKSADVKFQLHAESFWLPAIDMGLRDVSGTGLFSGEYVVSSKRAGPFDLSLGIGWGQVGARGNLHNPFADIKSSFANRPTVAIGSGGNFPIHTYFHGPAAAFGGLEWQTPLDSLVLKAEYDGNDYQHEPLGENFRAALPWNFGATWRATPSVDLSLGYERGNTVELSGTFFTNLSTLSTPKVEDAAPIPVVPHHDGTAKPLNWQKTRTDIHQQTEWDVTAISQHNETLFIDVDHAIRTYWSSYLDRAMTVVNRDAPDSIRTVVFRIHEEGLPIVNQKVDRVLWVAEHTQLLPPAEQLAPVQVVSPAPSPQQGRESILLKQPLTPISYRPGLSLSHFIGGPNGFVLYELTPTLNLQWHMTPRTWSDLLVKYDVLNNYNHFTYDAPSNLPRVRTNIRSYVETSRLNMDHWQFTHVGNLGDNQFWSMYAGYLEMMYAGVGGEWLYRPNTAPFAFGIDLNEVRQRDFAQHFGFLPYHVMTGHLSLYWDTGWHDVYSNIKIGQYLAKDRGATFDVHKKFSNGIEMGGYFTKTNLSSQQFGEGSFDKGLYINIPLDVISTRSSDLSTQFMWQPLLRDGGAMLNRQVALYDYTQARSDKTLDYHAATDPSSARTEDKVIKDPAHLYEPSPQLIRAPQTGSLDEAHAAPDTHQLNIALNTLGFRNIKIQEDEARRMTVHLDNHRLFEPSLAVGLAARTIMQQGPWDLRELTVIYNKHAIYNFYDMNALRSYFAGLSNEDQLRQNMSVMYTDDTYRPGDPLLHFGGLDEPSTPSWKQGQVMGWHPFDRGFRDLRGAYHSMTEQNWTVPIIAGTGLLLGSSLLDTSANRWASQHRQSVVWRSIKNVGNDLPWVADAAVAATAFGTDDPRLSRTSYASAEAAVSSYVATLAISTAVGRSRPTLQQGNHSFHWLSGSAGKKTDSFPSGHTVVSWAVLTPFAEEYNAPWLFGVAGITNVARVVGQNHWFSDTVASSILGATLGTLFWEGGTWKPDQLHISATPDRIAVRWDLKP